MYNNLISIIRRTACMLSVALLMLSSMIAVAAEVEAEAPAVAAPRLQVQLRAVKTHVLLGEPCQFVLSIVNDGEQAACIVRCFPPGSDYLNFEILEPRKQPRTLKPSSTLSGEGLLNRVFTLQPADAFSRYDLFMYEKSALMFREPGEYLFHAVYCLPDGVPGGPLTVRSNGVCVVAEQPVGVDKDVYDALTERIGKQSKSGIFWSGDPAYIPEYEALLAQYPRSGYAVFLRYYLAGAQALHSTLIATEPKEKISFLEKAIANYEAVADAAGDTPFGCYARQLAGHRAAVLGRFDRATAHFQAAFCAQSATTESQIEILSWISAQQRLHRNSGLATPGDDVKEDTMLPLLPYARALGYELTKDRATGESVLTRGDYRWVVTPGDRPLPVCGTLYKDMVVEPDKDGTFRVSPSVIAMLLAERYGKDMAGTLLFMLTKAE